MSSFNPDIRFFLQVADHVTDYHQAYVVPDLRVVNHVLQDSRVAHLRLFFNTLTKLDRSSLLLMIYKLTPLRVPNVSFVSQDNNHEAGKKIEDLKKLQARTFNYIIPYLPSRSPRGEAREGSNASPAPTSARGVCFFFK